MRVQVVTIFPEMVSTMARFGVIGRAIENGQVALGCKNPRDFATDAHRTVDDRPYGGGPGMVMKFEPTAAALAAASAEQPEGAPVVCLTPQGRQFDQSMARRFASLPGLTLLAGRYEGIDERLIDTHVDEELSLGDFILSGGEIAAMAVIDAVGRLIPGVLGDEDSAQQDSFMRGLLDYPHYTRPENVGGEQVPEVLLSGDHARIATWREKEALGRSFVRRPDLIERLELSVEQEKLLGEYLAEHQLSGERADRR